VTDIERLLKDALRAVGDDYDPEDVGRKRERFLRRRRRRNLALFATGTALAGAAAALTFVAFWSVEATPQRDVPVASNSTDAVVAAQIEVGAGAQPSGVASGAGYIWVANLGDGTVSAVDPDTNEMVRKIPVGFERGRPDDVVVRGGRVWVVSDAGEVAWIEPDTGEATSIGSQGDGHVDVAKGSGDDVWLLPEDGDVVHIDAVSGETLGTFPRGEDTTDVAASDGTVWIYDRATGDVIAYDVATEAELFTVAVGSSKSADLSAGAGYAWFYRGSDGTLLQIEQASGSVLKEYPLGGTFGAISIGPESVYALVVDGGPSGTGDGRLFRFDATEATRIGKNVALSNLPFDVDWSRDAIWVTNNAGDTLTRIDLVAKGETPAPEPTPEIAEPARTTFYYAAGGDIHAYDADGTSEPVVATRALETSPTLAPDGSALVFQRGEGLTAKIVYRALTEDAIYGSRGEETVVARGQSPSFGPDGRIAWSIQPKSTGITKVVVGTLGTDDRLEILVDSGLGPYTIDRIGWTSDSSALYFHASYEWDSIYRAVIPGPGGEASDVKLEEVTPVEEGSAFISPAVAGSDGLGLIRLCCGSFPEWENVETADLGVVEDGAFAKLIGLDDLGWEPSFELVAAWAGSLDYESATGWSGSDKPTWFVSNQEELWLVNTETREMDNLGIDGVTDIALVPNALSD
jgi:YVTN family beta-propeller protein